MELKNSRMIASSELFEINFPKLKPVVSMLEKTSSQSQQYTYSSKKNPVTKGFFSNRYHWYNLLAMTIKLLSKLQALPRPS
jgi:hypothetical protein